jgi:dUTP pyrophosphatase
MKKIKVKISAPADIDLPSYATDGSAGADVRAHLSEECVIEPGEARLIPTGIKLDIPEGYEIQVRPRSGLALKHQITVLNTPGTIDSDYRGEIGVILINHSKISFTVLPKMRIAQLVLAPVVWAEFIPEKELAGSLRGEGGFGHTGSH